MHVRRPLARALTTATAAAMLLGTLVPGVAQAFHSTTVTVGDFFFEPDAVTVKVGDDVTWKFVGEEPHTVTAVDGSFNSGVKLDGTFTHTFAQAGTIGYFCEIHPWMEGTVEVAPASAVDLDATDTVSAALAWSETTFADGGSNVALIARSDLYPDALASGPVQGLRDAPLLLTPSGSLAAAVRAELDRLGVSKVVLLGGENAISPRVKAQLEASGRTVTRVAGADRIDTAVRVAQRFFPNAEQAIVARAFGDASDETRGFADALAAGAVGAQLGVPVLLTHTEGLSAATREYLETSDISSVIVAGGPAAISDKAVADLERIGVAVQRAEGPTRFETAIALAEATGHLDFSKVLLVDGTAENAWASGFAAAAAAARGGVLLLTDGAGISTTVQSALIDEGPAVVCGPFVDAAACELADIASSSVAFGTEGALLAVLEAVEGVEPAFQGGAFEARRTGDAQALCYSYEALVVEEITAAHIHRVSDGTAAVPLSVEPTMFGTIYGCATDLDAALVRDILNNPGDYYMNVHTETYPKGVISGPLFDPSFFSFAFMSGDQEPAGGDPAAFGFGGVFGDEADADRLCYFLFLEIEATPTAAHIHDAETNEAVVTLEVPAEGAPPVVFGCADGLDPQVVAAIAADPNGYYVNVHTEEYPKGALRGTLIGHGADEVGAAGFSSFRVS